MTDPDGNTTRWVYDGENRVIEQVDPLGNHEYYTYDAVGNLLKQIDNSGQVTRYTYDNLYRQTSETWQQEVMAPQVLGANVFYNGSPLFSSDDGAIDPNKQPLSPGDTATGANYTNYDQGINGIMIDIRNLPDDGADLTAADFTFRVGTDGDPTDWDTVGDTSTITVRPGAGVDGSDRVTITWDDGSIADEWLQVTVKGGTGTHTGLTTPDVFYFGNQIGDTDWNFAVDQTDFNQLTTDLGATGVAPFTTDDFNQDGNVDQSDFNDLTEELGATFLQLAAPSTRLQQITYSYDADSQLTAVTDRDGSNNLEGADYSYTYDNLGNLLSTTSTIAGLTPTVTLNQSFDDDGNRTQLAATIGSTNDFVNNYTYDPLNELTQLTQQGQSGGNTVADKLVNFTYNADGQFSTIDRYAGANLVATSTYGYNSLQQLDSLTHQQNSGNVFATYTWTYNGDNQVQTFDNSQHTDEDATYSYDRTGQLTNVVYGDSPTTTQDYTYDSNGNPTNTGDSTGTNNQLTSDGTFNYTYDNNGNMLTKTRISSDPADDYETDYAWDFRNRLTSVTLKKNDGDVTQKVVYAYDAFDRLVGLQVFESPSETLTSSQHFIYDGEEIVESLSDTGAVQNRYLWGPEVDQLLAQEDSSHNVLWALSDNENTVRDYVQYNSSTSFTSVVDHAQYDAFGNRSNTSSVDAAFGWTGRYSDPVTGLQYNSERWYDPSTSRWLSQDPTGFNGDISNLYRYVGNSPANWIDPEGLEPTASGGPFNWESGVGSRPVDEVWGYSLSFQFTFGMGGQMTLYHLWDTQGREAWVVGGSARVGLQGDLSGNRVDIMGTNLCQFLNGSNTLDVSVGLRSGFGGTKEIGGGPTSIGFGLGGGVSIGYGRGVPIWKNF